VGGVEFGYRFNWYLYGPYSPALTRDYYKLSEEMIEGDVQADRAEVSDSEYAALRRLGKALAETKPRELSDEDWLVLLASLHFLRTSSRLPRDEAIKVLERQKEKLAPYSGEAENALMRLGLLT
jgi:hypothetical protein